MELIRTLKGDFHMHTKDDPVDYKYITHSAEELIDHAAGLGFEVLSLTAHDKISYSPYLREYAAHRGILLLPGTEVTIEGAHVLLINYLGTVEFKSLRELEKIRAPEVLIIAAHPYYPGPALRRKLEEHIELFDAIEYCHFYHRFVNFFNQRAVSISKKYQKPLVGTSDTHFLCQMDQTYSMIEVNRKTPAAVVESIKAGKVRVVTHPLSLSMLLKIMIKFKLLLL